MLVVSTSASFWWLASVVVGAIATSTIAERLAPYEPAWNRARGDLGRDLLHALVNEAATVGTVALIPLVRELIPTLDVWPSGWPLLAQLGLAIVVADAGITLTHRASHHFAPLWRLHAVHHAVERMYGCNGLVKHPLHQAIETLVGTSPLLVLGMSSDVGTLLAIAVVVQLLLQHSNVDMRVGWAGYVWAVAPAHRHHHLASASLGNVNYGLFTLVWDHLMGTFAGDRPPPQADEVGIAERSDYPRAYLEQLAEPFRCV